MTDKVDFTLDGKTVSAAEGETIWDVAKREGTRIPHLCHVDLPGYRPDGNCRACMVEIDGERVLAASCIRKPAAGMVVKTDTERAREVARDGVRAFGQQHAAGRCRARQPVEFLAMGVVDGHRRQQPLRQQVRRPRGRRIRHHQSRHRRQPRRLHRLRRLRARLPRSAGQRRHRHGRSRRPHDPGLRHARPDGPVDLRELRRVRAGLPDRRAVREEPDGQGGQDPRGGRIRQGRQFALSLLRRRLPDARRRQGQPDRPDRRAQRLRQRKPAVRQGTLRFRLCDVVRAADQAPDPARRCAEVGRGRPARRRSDDRLPRSHLGRGAGARRQRPEEDPHPAWRAFAGRLRLGQGLQRGGLSVPEAGAPGLRHQQCRPLHQALPCLVGRRPHGGRRLGRGVGAVHRRAQGRVHHGHRRPADDQPSRRRDLLQAGRQARRQADRHRPARPGPDAPCQPFAALPRRQRRRPAELVPAHHHRGEALRRAVYPGQRRRASRR